MVKLSHLGEQRRSEECEFNQRQFLWMGISSTSGQDTDSTMD
ncbi:hypothetical protein [Leptolyngbya sp. GB1-A1]